MQKALIILLTTIILASIIIAFLIRIIDESGYQDPLPQNSKIETIETKAQEFIDKEEEEEEIMNIPIEKSLLRITKKPFGIYVTPQNSTVSPEKFTGFHTGTDFEIFDNELNDNIEVKAICDGDIIQKTSVNGYGGVVIQKCQYEDNPVLVLYGHINPSTFTEKIEIKKGDPIVFLSPDNSPQSGFERKHLHIGIIKGEEIDYRGYVQSKNELNNWIDPINFLR